MHFGSVQKSFSDALLSFMCGYKSVRAHVCVRVCVCESVGYNQTSLPPPPKISNNGHLYRIVITHRGGSQRISNWTVRTLFHIKYGKIGGKRNE